MTAKKNDTVRLDVTPNRFQSQEYRSVVAEGAEFFKQTPIYDFPLAPFDGAGVYGLYYTGAHVAYIKINTLEHGRPIYIGKAVPAGSRTANTKSQEKKALYKRLNEHGNSIKRAPSLALADFHCRFIILDGVESDLIVPLESELIRQLKPVWNSVIDGFGNHPVGGKRKEQKRASWDVLHPGRISAATGDSFTAEEILQKIAEFFAEPDS